MTATIKAFERPGQGPAQASTPVSTTAPVPVAPPAPTARAPEPSAHIPAAISARFHEAQSCYAHGLWQASAAMCRLAMEAILADVGSAGRLRVFDLVNDTHQAAALDQPSVQVVRGILFEGAPVRADLERWHAAVLIETLKDLLAQQYVRPARLRQAFAVRRYFAEGDGNGGSNNEGR